MAHSGLSLRWWIGFEMGPREIRVRTLGVPAPGVGREMEPWGT